MSKSILLLDGDGTQTLAIAKTIHKKGYIIHGFYDSKLSYGYHTRYVDHKVVSPSILEEDNYLNFLTDYIKNQSIDVIIPLADNSAHFLSKYKSRLIHFSKFIVPDIEIFNRGYDKNSLMNICAANGYPHPKTIDLKSNYTIDESIFPALIKPNITTGARGMKLVNSIEEFKQFYPQIKKQYGECHLQEFIQPGGAQIEIQILTDDQFNLLNSSVIYKYRWYPEKGGSSCCNISVYNDEIVNICHNLMKSLGWSGFADFDTIEDPKDGKLKIMELNPRVPACVKSAIVSGIDWGNIIIDASEGNKNKFYKYSPGKKLRHIGFEVLWFFSCSDRFRTKPNWFNFFSKNLYFQDFSWDDPLPFFFGTWGNIKKQLNPSFRKSKSGLRR